MSDHEWHDITRYNFLIMPQKSMRKLYKIKPISTPLHLAPHKIILILSILLWLHLARNRTHFQPAELVWLLDVSRSD